MEWQEGTPPKEGKYLVWYEYWRYHTLRFSDYGVAEWQGWGWEYVREDDGGHAEIVVKWMPLPKPPVSV